MGFKIHNPKMNIEALHEYAICKPNAEACFPFGEETLVFKINGKIFLLASLDSHPLKFNVKCNPDKALELREKFPDAVLPGYHMNKKHWNTIIINGQLKNHQLQEMIDDSYALVKGK
jgi:predicted DNA-binding protein (MmcQ/YjbR family)